MSFTSKILLLGAGELGKEFVISAKRVGAYVIAVDKYPQAPAMQVADEYEVIDMLDGQQLQTVVERHQPDYIVPEIESICTEQLLTIEQTGYNVVPNAIATNMTMNRDAIRNLAAEDLQLRTAKYSYATNLIELQQACQTIGFPCVVKPVMSSSGKGQTTLSNIAEIESAWQIACSKMRGEKQKVIIEEFIQFDSEITLLTIKQHQGNTLFITPIGHRQQDGDYRESWLPATVSESHLQQAKTIATKITDRLGGAGVFGVEFFITKNAVIFSELSPRPHDTGMVTMISQNLSEFDLHVRAILGLPIPEISYYGPAASAVILAEHAYQNFSYTGLSAALAIPQTQVRIFAKPHARKNRRMGVALAKGATVSQAIERAKLAATKIQIKTTSTI